MENMIFKSDSPDFILTPESITPVSSGELYICDQWVKSKIKRELNQGVKLQNMKALKVNKLKGLGVLEDDVKKRSHKFRTFNKKCCLSRACSLNSANNRRKLVKKDSIKHLKKKVTRSNRELKYNHCPTRIMELALPSKRHCIETWKNKYHILSPLMLERLKNYVLDDVPLVKISDAINCFKKRKITTKRSKIKRIFLPADEMVELKKICGLLAGHIARKLMRPMNLTLDNQLKKISFSVLTDIRRISKKRSRLNKFNENLTSEISDKVAVWIADILEFSDNKMLEDDLRDLDEEEGPVLDFIEELIDLALKICKEKLVSDYSINSTSYSSMRDPVSGTSSNIILTKDSDNRGSLIINNNLEPSVTYVDEQVISDASEPIIKETVQPLRAIASQPTIYSDFLKLERNTTSDSNRNIITALNDTNNITEEIHTNKDEYGIINDISNNQPLKSNIEEVNNTENNPPDSFISDEDVNIKYSNTLQNERPSLELIATGKTSTLEFKATDERSSLQFTEADKKLRLELIITENRSIVLKSQEKPLQEFNSTDDRPLLQNIDNKISLQSIATHMRQSLEFVAPVKILSLETPLINETPPQEFVETDKLKATEKKPFLEFLTTDMQVSAQTSGLIELYNSSIHDKKTADETEFIKLNFDINEIIQESIDTLDDNLLGSKMNQAENIAKHSSGNKLLKQIFFLTANYKLISNYDEIWPEDLSLQNIKLSKSKSKSAMSLRNIIETLDDDEYNMITNIKRSNHSIAEISIDLRTIETYKTEQISGRTGKLLKDTKQELEITNNRKNLNDNTRIKHKNPVTESVENKSKKTTKFEYKVDPETAPLWLKQYYQDLQYRDQQIIEKSLNREYANLRDINIKTEDFYLWLEYACKTMINLKLREGLLKGNGISDWMKLKQRIDQDALKWERFYSQMRRKLQHNNRRCNCFNYE